MGRGSLKSFGRNIRRLAGLIGLVVLAAVVVIQVDPTGQLLLMLTCVVIGGAMDRLWLNYRRPRRRRRK